MLNYLLRKSKNYMYLEGPSKLQISEYGGLGQKYFRSLGERAEKINQISATTGLTESMGAVRGRAIQLALAMMDLNVGVNDIVVICSRTNTDQTVVVLASLFLGSIICPLDPDITANQCKSFMKQLKPKICFCDTRSVFQIEKSLHDCGLQSKLVNFGRVLASCTQFLKLFMHPEEANFKPVVIKDTKMTVAFVIPTQGTISDPKLVCLSHNNIVLQTAILHKIIGEPERLVSFYPLSYFLEVISMCLSFEHQMVRVLPGNFTERLACKLIQDMGIDFGFFGTAMTNKILRSAAVKDFDISRIKCIVVGGIATTKYEMETYRSRFPNTKFIQIYCLTETGIIAANDLHKYSESCDKPSSTGHLISNCKVKIVDIKENYILEPNNLGELLFYGDGLMLGYFKNLEKTCQAIERGYFKTGDLAEYDEEGWLYVKDRICDIFQRDILISPICIEEVILQHPFVNEVCVIGNEKEMIAIVVKKPDSNLAPYRLMSYLYDRLSPDLNPTQIVFFDELPKTSCGSIRRSVLKARFFQVKIEYNQSVSNLIE